jgi:hypothetical protein
VTEVGPPHRIASSVERQTFSQLRLCSIEFVVIASALSPLPPDCSVVSDRVSVMQVLVDCFAMNKKYA